MKFPPRAKASASLSSGTRVSMRIHRSSADDVVQAWKSEAIERKLMDRAELESALFRAMLNGAFPVTMQRIPQVMQWWYVHDLATRQCWHLHETEAMANWDYNMLSSTCPGPHWNKFVPECDDKAGQRLRKKLDKHNAAEAKRRAKKADNTAAAAAALASGWSSSTASGRSSSAGLSSSATSSSSSIWRWHEPFSY